jgi:hypothetical protein
MGDDLFADILDLRGQAWDQTTSSEAMKNLAGQVDDLKLAYKAGQVSAEELQQLLAFKLDAVLAVIYAEQGVAELEQARFREGLLKVLKKPLRDYFGFDVLV